MYTDQNKINNEKDIIYFLGLTPETNFGELNTGQFLASIWKFGVDIWKNPEYKYFTNHDLSHSINIIRFFKEFDQIYKWSDYEKLLFCSAAIMHDWGMQYSQWIKRIGWKTKFTKELNDFEVREHHGELGFEFIKYYLHSKRPFVSLSEICDKTNIEETKSLSIAARIGFSHSSDVLKNEFISNKTNSWSSRTIFPEKYQYRPRLLAGVLCLCDEFDCTFSRLIRSKDLHSDLLNQESKKHWLASLFIENVLLSFNQEMKNGHLQLVWVIPEANKSDKKKISSVRDFIEKFRNEKIRKEINNVNRFLEDCKESDYKINLSVEPLDSKPHEVGFELNPKYYQLINNYLLDIKKMETKIDSKYSNLDLQNNIIDEIDEFKVIISSEKNLQGKYRFIEKELTKWFEREAVSGHFALKTGEHTDVYLNCRTLVSNQKLLNKLSEIISEIFKKQKIVIDNVLAVGTSAIPLAVCTSYKLNSKVTFTVSNTKVAQNNDQKLSGYISTEVRPIINKNDTILIIDDLISGGKVAIKTIEIIKEVEKDFMGTIYHLSIFRLGSRVIHKDNSIKKYFWIKQFSDPIYFPVTDCFWCNNKLSDPKDESEMY